MLIFLTLSYSFILKFDLPMCGNEQVGIFIPKMCNFENVSYFIKVSGEEKFLLFQLGEITGKSAMLFYWYAWCKNVDSW